MSKADVRKGGDGTGARWAELIDSAQGGGAAGDAAARTLLEAFISGERDRRLTDYIARCLAQYLRGGVPIELALHLSSALPPVVLGPAGEGDRRTAQRASRREAESAGRQVERRRLAREQEDRGRRRATVDKPPDKRGRERPERRRKTAAPAPETD